MRTIENTLLRDICRTAALRYQQDAAMYRQLAQMPPVEGYEGPLGADAARLADSYELQAAEARGLAEVFEQAWPFTVTMAQGQDRSAPPR